MDSSKTAERDTANPAAEIGPRAAITSIQDQFAGRQLEAHSENVRVPRGEGGAERNLVGSWLSPELARASSRATFKAAMSPWSPAANLLRDESGSSAKRQLFPCTNLRVLVRHEAEMGVWESMRSVILLCPSYGGRTDLAIKKASELKQ